MAKHPRADTLLLAGFSLEVGAAGSLLFWYWLQHLFVVACALMVVAGCLFSLGLVAFMYAGLALGGNTHQLSDAQRQENH
jgi:hypothetical protein